MALRPCIVNAATIPASVGHGACSVCKQPLVPGFRHLDLDVATERNYWEFLDTRPVHTGTMDQFTDAYKEWVDIRQKYEVKIVLGLYYDHHTRKSTKKAMAPLTGRR